MGAAVVGVGLGNAVGFQQIPVKFRFQLHMAGAAVRVLFLHVGVAHGIQAVMPQQSQKIDPPGLVARLGADPGEKFLPGLGMECAAQLPRGGFDQGVIVKENIRPVQTHIIQPPEPLDAPAVVGAHSGKQLLSEAVMGVICWHETSPRCFFSHFSILHDNSEKEKLFFQKFTANFCKAGTLQCRRHRGIMSKIAIFEVRYGNTQALL